MPHKCTKCGREFKDGTTDILKGCPSCGGKKFLYIKPEDLHKDILEEKSIEDVIEEKKDSLLEVSSSRDEEPVEIYERIESIRVLNPGSYELNLEKLAKSDEMVMQMGKDDKYIVDLLSMGKVEKDKKKKKKK
ncbi:Zn-ribbon domain-containing protein [Methanolacinia paynteri]|uniref:Zn-ribbon domain-containing protein n=1 Tax=Methanolacinia paynteri TaxID=230356 RepID=UPI00064EAF8A|nr:Zn-ribbon domain-containing protein [Methanolacinia paynteri]